MLEPRQIEAALHDGVQQDLVAASVSLQLAVQLLDTDPVAARGLLVELEGQLRESLERVRALAQEIYPSILAARGLRAALGFGPDGRYPLEVEEAVYFACCLLGADVRLWSDEGELRLEATGAFGDEAIADARERIASVGGQLTASGGSVVAAVPVSPSAR